MRVGEGHVKVRVDRVERIPHEQEDLLALEPSEAFSFGEVGLHHSNTLIDHALPL